MSQIQNSMHMCDTNGQAPEIDENVANFIQVMKRNGFYN